MTTYDTSNIFARILRGDIPCKKMFESEHVLAFHDISPQAPVHILIIPKGAYINAADFSARASDAEITGFTRAISHVAKEAGLSEGGFRLIANCGINGGQEVPHYHVHMLGGRRLGRMVEKA